MQQLDIAKPNFKPNKPESRVRKAWGAIRNFGTSLLAESIVTLATSALLVGCGGQSARNLTDAQIDGQKDGHGEIFDGGKPCNEWVKTYSNGQNAFVTGVTTDFEGNIVVTETTWRTAYDVEGWMRKMTSQGKEIWAQTISAPSDASADVAMAVAKDVNGNLYFTGHISINGIGGNTNLFIRKTDPHGYRMWDWIGNVLSYNHGSDIKADTRGNVYVVGTTSAVDPSIVNSDTNVFVAKLDGNSDPPVVKWIRTYNGSAQRDDSGYGVDFDTKGNVYVNGFENFEGTNANGRNAWIRKYDLNGEVLWTRTLPSPSWGSGIKVVDDNVYATGLINNRFWIQKMDLQGNVLWTKTGNDDNFDSMARRIDVDNSGNSYIVGEKTTLEGDNDVFVRKFNPDGVEQWTKTYNGKENHSETGFAITINLDGNLIAVGAGIKSEPNIHNAALILNFCNQ